MNENMTVISANMFEKAINENLTNKEAIELLKNEACIRSLKNKLERFAFGKDLKKVLVDGLMEHNPDAVRDSVARKVRGWLSEGERTISKKDAIELCFILKLNFSQADEFVTMVSEERLHWRDPEELPFIYALNNNLDFETARRISEETKQYINSSLDTEEIANDSFTPLIRNEVLLINNEDELKDYVKNASMKLGKYHNTAYKLFMEYLELLKNPYEDEELFEEKALSTREIVREYFNQELIPRFKQGKSEEGKRAVLSAMEKNILANWPDEVMLSKIKNREADVPRKVLILAFLVTNGGESDYGDDDPEEYYEMTKEDLFREMFQRINTMLQDCGFSRLDPRVPFDWMILYCMCVEETYEIDDRMKNFLGELFK